MKEILVKSNDEYGTHWYHEELIQCKDCKHFDGDTWCYLFEHGIQENDFCSRAERAEE